MPAFYPSLGRRITDGDKIALERERKDIPIRPTEVDQRMRNAIRDDELRRKCP
jgi:hypothetical protein